MPCAAAANPAPLHCRPADRRPAVRLPGHRAGRRAGSGQALDELCIVVPRSDADEARTLASSTGARLALWTGQARSPRRWPLSWATIRRGRPSGRWGRRAEDPDAVVLDQDARAGRRGAGAVGGRGHRRARDAGRLRARRRRIRCRRFRRRCVGHGGLAAEHAQYVLRRRVVQVGHDHRGAADVRPVAVHAVGPYGFGIERAEAAETPSRSLTVEAFVDADVVERRSISRLGNSGRVAPRSIALRSMRLMKSCWRRMRPWCWASSFQRPSSWHW